MRAGRQVRRNARESKQAKSRRLVLSAWQRWRARGETTASAAYWKAFKGIASTDAEAIGKAFADGFCDGVVMVIESPGGTFDAYNEQIAWAQREIEQALLGRTVS